MAKNNKYKQMICLNPEDWLLLLLLLLVLLLLLFILRLLLFKAVETIEVKVVRWLDSHTTY